MLTTRCPHCQTTFRITSVALHKAAGKVRCGQCAEVFSAFDSLTDTQTRISVDELLQSTMTEVSDPAAADTPIRKIQPDAQPATESAVPHTRWYPSEPGAAPEPPGWRIAAAVAAVALLLQVVHHARAPLSTMPYAGGTLERFYSLIGHPIAPAVDPAHFTIVNWVATAQTVSNTSAAAQSALEISAGVRNNSSQPLPYPLLSLELTDRWEKIIGARVFTAEEYTGRRMSGNARIRANATVTAQLQLVDPGPDAYGFEVDICVAVDERRMRCTKSDSPFQ